MRQKKYRASCANRWTETDAGEPPRRGLSCDNALPSRRVTAQHISLCAAHGCRNDVASPDSAGAWAISHLWRAPHHRTILPPYNLKINHKRVARVMRAMGLNRKPKRKKRKTTQSQHEFPRFPNLLRDLVIERPEQVWVCDITYIHLAHEDVYLAVLMDLYTRSIRGWYLGRSLEQALTLNALPRALKNGCPEIHHSDQGVQYASPKYVQVLRAHHVQVSMAEVGEATQNAHAERLMRTIKEEEVNLSEYRDLYDARQRIGHFLDEVYQHKRIHSALGYLTPAEYENNYRARAQII